MDRRQFLATGCLAVAPVGLFRNPSMDEGRIKGLIKQKFEPIISKTIAGVAFGPRRQPNSAILNACREYWDEVIAQLDNNTHEFEFASGIKAYQTTRVDVWFEYYDKPLEQRPRQGTCWHNTNGLKERWINEAMLTSFDLFGPSHVTLWTDLLFSQRSLGYNMLHQYQVQVDWSPETIKLKIDLVHKIPVES